MADRSQNLKRLYKKNRGLTLAILTLLIIGAAVFSFQKFNRHVPPEFLSAREEAAATAEQIVQLSNASRNNIQEIEAKDSSRDYKAGLTLIETERNRNAEMNRQAGVLAGELQAMAYNLTGIKPKQAVLIGAQAVSTAVEMSKRLDAYINYSYELLAAFEDRFKGDNSAATKKEIDEVIGKMNGEVDQINQLNNQYKQQMDQFNRLTS